LNMKDQKILDTKIITDEVARTECAGMTGSFSVVFLSCIFS